MVEFLRFFGRFLIELSDQQLSAITLLSLTCGMLALFPVTLVWPVALPLTLLSTWLLLSIPRAKSTTASDR